ncbi:hypothetical protein LTR37_008653 [Vermiconidia calcicola]|uniref:Uncharacterized protein n=1 Tax=Vermiconidia calcicola TaxID=1690605 RepID=A0ACC3NBG0_9PEZI|nr:hypothetical protein LTR37_008653 [Vermiconidia calcicola]
MSLDELKEISTDPQTTADALKFDSVKLVPSSPPTDEQLAERVVSLYDLNKATVTAEDVVLANGTTGANLLVCAALLSPGDHVVCTYPAYAALVDVPRGVGAEVSYTRLYPENDWKLDLEDLKAKLKPSTKMIILNNPHNPTGSVLSTAEQAEIVKIASEQNIIIFTDEIFRPLFHTGDTPTSMLEHPSYSRIVVTGSLSKTLGFPGVRIGWVATRDRKIRDTLLRVRDWTLQDISVIDKIIAMEILSERCHQQILSKNLGFARENLEVLRSFVKDNKESVSCSMPAGAATAFVKFSNPKTGEAIDDLQFCLRLKQDTGVLLSPGSLCFGPEREGDFKGYVRMHITVPSKTFEEALERLRTFLTSSAFAELNS